MTRQVLILGGGTAGTIAANRLRRALTDDWSITVVDQSALHHYQPGYLFVPFGTYAPDDVVRPRRRYLADGVHLVLEEVDTIDAAAAAVALRDGRVLPYDYLVIATGTTPRPDQTPGMDGPGWRDTVHDFYTLEGAEALAGALRSFRGGRVVVHVTEMPIKCPVAPLELTFLLDAWLTDRGLRDRVELVYATPLEGAFTKPIASQHLGGMLADRGIALEPDFVVEHVDGAAGHLVSMDEREIPFDLLVTVPLNMGSEAVLRSGLGDELGFAPVDRHTLLSTEYDNVFAVGDAAALPTSKAGSVAHFQMEHFAQNFVDHVHGREMTSSFDGHASCFIESGHGKALLVDFGYDTEPLPGRYPLPGVGPFTLLAESEFNHWGKLMFRWAYWNVLLPGRELPLPALHSVPGTHEERVA
jgi:sulfide:quinone oxidoreductase